MTQKHAQEPWARGDRLLDIVSSKGNLVARLAGTVGKCEIEDANLRRIVACVNAMSGIADDNSLFFQGNSVRSVISNMKLKELDIESQRNQLQAEVDELLDLLQSLENDAAQIPQFMWTKIQRVVKKHTGETK